MLLLLIAIQAAVAAASPCILCPDGSSTTLPEKIVDIPGVPVVDCATIARLVPVLFQDDTSQECQLVHQLSTLCGCPRDENSCSLCSGDSDGSSSGVSKPTALVGTFSPIFGGIAPNCEVVEAYLHSFSEDDAFCGYAQQEAWDTCGCPVGGNNLDDGDGRYTGGGGGQQGFNNVTQPTTIPTVDIGAFTLGFFGTKGSGRGAMLYSLMRASAILSVIGALVVIFDNLRNRKKMQGLFNQLMVLMAFFDIIYSIAVALVDIPRPTDDFLSTSEERGNMTTCRIQGFMIQFGGLTSLFCNVSLSTCKS